SRRAVYPRPRSVNQPASHRQRPSVSLQGRETSEEASVNGATSARGRMLAGAFMVAAGGACSVTPLVSETATPAQMGYGIARVDELGSRSLIVGAAAHTGSVQARVGDTVWRIRVGALELCDGSASRCTKVETDGVAPDTILLARDEEPRSVFASSQHRDGVI